MEKRFFVFSNGSEMGPFSISELISMAARGEFGPGDHVRRESGGGWISAGGVNGLIFGSKPARLIAVPVKKKSWLAYYLFAACAGLLGIAMIVVRSPERIPEIARTINPETNQEMIARVMKSTVTVRTDKGLGSGFFLIDKQTIATNLHVVEGTRDIVVELSDGSPVRVAGFVYADPGSDVALLRLTQDCGAAAPLPIATSNPVQGQRVFTFGSPGGMQHSVSDGLVSAIRTAREFGEAIGNMHELGLANDCSVTQITAPISPGSSGGPLVSEIGSVLGINTAIYRKGQGVNFAVGLESIKKAVEKTHAVKFLQDLPLSLAAQRGLDIDLFVQSLLKDTANIQLGAFAVCDMSGTRELPGAILSVRYPTTWKSIRPDDATAVRAIEFVEGTFSARMRFYARDTGVPIEQIKLRRAQEALLSEANAAEMIPRGAAIVEYERAERDGLPVANVRYVVKSNGRTIASDSVHFVRRSKLISIESSVIAPDGDNESMGICFVMCRPAFRRILATLRTDDE